MVKIVHKLSTSVHKSGIWAPYCGNLWCFVAKLNVNKTCVDKGYLKGINNIVQSYRGSFYLLRFDEAIFPTPRILYCVKDS